MRLTLPAACGEQLVDEVVAERQAGVNAAFFNGLAAEWRSRVANYLAHGGSPEHVPTWPAIDGFKGTFHNLYSHPADGSAQGEVLRMLRNHGLDLCPACGEGGTPNTLDHYLPKNRFAHFSITPANLFPMCDACQLAKGQKTGDQANPRYFIHPYFDTFTQPQILTLTIAPPFETPNFALTPNPNLTGIEQILVGTHLRELNVYERYITFFRNEYRRLLRQVGNMRTNGQNIIGTLETFAIGYEDPTPNRWEHVFIRGVLTNDEITTYLITAQLPEHL